MGNVSEVDSRHTSPDGLNKSGVVYSFGYDELVSMECQESTRHQIGRSALQSGGGHRDLDKLGVNVSGGQVTLYRSDGLKSGVIVGSSHVIRCVEIFRRYGPQLYGWTVSSQIQELLSGLQNFGVSILSGRVQLLFMGARTVLKVRVIMDLDKTGVMMLSRRNLFATLQMDSQYKSGGVSDVNPKHSVDIVMQLYDGHSHSKFKGCADLDKLGIIGNVSEMQCNFTRSGGIPSHGELYGSNTGIVEKQPIGGLRSRHGQSALI
ncbi:hypothetical protein AVEN_3959-1 [Araneus ventricosus]|uniref:Uncharacterized protein n=1 Tax=Araneus ventricosus TaxID=182803 RepID=A0A4Y2SPU5_ARAVE|nr:hypothetical protein AVEN_3959-1 [Araneus ventricosus]